MPHLQRPVHKLVSFVVRQGLAELLKNEAQFFHVDLARGFGAEEAEALLQAVFANWGVDQARVCRLKKREKRTQWYQTLAVSSRVKGRRQCCFRGALPDGAKEFIEFSAAHTGRSR